MTLAGVTLARLVMGVLVSDRTMPDGSATAHLFGPKLLTLTAEGYHLASLRKDAIAGLTVAVVALPLSMAIAVASGVSPERGLYAAIVGGFLVSALGGSRFQVGGPAGAFIVLVSAVAANYGLGGLLLVVMMSGLFLTLIGLSGLGAFIRYIPQTVTVGFTCGIAVTILASQLRDLGGLNLSGAEPGHLIPKLITLARALPSINPGALAFGVCSATLIFLLRRWRPLWPGMLIAIAMASLAAAMFNLPVETIGSRIGGIPRSLPSPALPTVTWPLLLELLPTAISFTLLGGVESLLSAKIADGMTGRKHRYNMELVAQGIANVASALFGGISVTGTIARTATNIRAGAQPGRRHAARGVPAGFHGARSASGQIHSPCCTCRSSAGCVLEHGREGGVRKPAAELADRHSGAHHVRTHAGRRPDGRHRGGLLCRGRDRILWAAQQLNSDCNF